MAASICTAQPPLLFNELDYCLLKCRMVRRGLVVAITLGGTCGWDFLEKPLDLLIGRVRLAIEYQSRYVDFLECFRRQSTRDYTANHRRQDLRISSRHPSRYQIRRGEVSRNDFPLLQDSRPLFRPHPNSKRTSTESGTGQFAGNSKTVSSMA
jgi:hypothetical protein